MSALVGSSRRFGALAMIAGASTSWVLRQSLGARNRPQRSLKCLFAGSRWRASMRVGDGPNRSNKRVVALCRCLEWRQAVSDCLLSAATVSNRPGD
jgi:hypothetical protein